MTEVDLLNKIAAEGWSIIEQRTVGDEGSGDSHLVTKRLMVFKPESGVIVRREIFYNVKADGSCYWLRDDPFPTYPPPSPVFTDTVSSKINALISAGTIKAGYIERFNEAAKTAVVVAVTISNEFKVYHVWQDASQTIQVVALTGTYPIG